MHKLRIIGLATVVVCAALAAYFWWPVDAPQEPPPPPVAVAEPTTPPSQLPLPPLEPMPSIEKPSEKDTLAEEPITSVANLTLFFFDDLAQWVVERYHPAQTEHNATDKGVLLLSLSAMNLRYGVEMIGLEYTAPSVPEAREEIFEAMLRPEVIDAAWQAFSAYFLQALIDQALSAKRVATTPVGVGTERALSTAEVSEFLQLLSSFISQVSQAGSLFIRSDQAISLTNSWLEARAEVLSANSRYQHVIALLEEALAKSPTDQDRIHSLRVQRNAAAQEIMASIKTREQIKQRLLTIYKNDSLTKNMPETELLFISQWLYRRLHKHPERSEAIALLFQRSQQFSENLKNAAGSIQGLASE